MVLDLHEDIDYDFIGQEVESVVEVLHSTLRMLLEDFELRVGLVELERDDAANDVGEHVLEGELVAVVVCDGRHCTRVLPLLTLQCSFLTHHTDGFVGRLDLEGLNLANIHSSDKLSSRLPNRHALLFLLLSSQCLGCEISSLFSVHEANLVSDHLSVFNMLVDHTLSSAHHGCFVSNTLKFLILQFFSDGVLGVLGHGLVLVPLVLLLYHL